MPRNIIGAPPFVVRTLDTDEPLTLAQLQNALGESPAVSLCVRSVSGPNNRGGYFFHFQRAATGFLVCDFEKNAIGVLEPPDLVRFINHVSGRRFDPEMLSFCQSVVNFRQDQIAAETIT